MLTFIVPLKSKSTAVSWQRVSRLFNRTIASACAQKSPEFRVIVICHEIPAGDWTDPRLEFISVDYQIKPNATMNEKRNDASRKRLIGFNRAVELTSSHVMFLDSDDCVSNQLAGHVAKKPGSTCISWNV